MNNFQLPPKMKDAEFKLFAAVRVGPNKGIERALNDVLDRVIRPLWPAFIHEPHVVEKTDRLALVIMVGLQTPHPDRRRDVVKLLGEIAANSPPVEQIRVELQRLINGGPLKKPNLVEGLLVDAGAETPAEGASSPQAINLLDAAPQSVASGSHVKSHPVRTERVRIGSDPSQIAARRLELIKAGLIKRPGGPIG